MNGIYAICEKRRRYIMEKPEMEFSAKKTLVNIVVYFCYF